METRGEVGAAERSAGEPDAIENPVLRCVGLRKNYRGDSAFELGSQGNGLTFSVNRGELFALVGPSGCGKTTTLGIIGGFIRPDAGAVIIDGADITRHPPYARPTNTVFQSYALFPHMSVGANVAFGLAMERVPRRDRRARVGEALELVGLTGFEQRRIAELSGGQQQRAAMARALIKRPALLLLDEPMGSLDAQLRKQMQSELVRLKTSTHTTFVHVTHDQEEACAIADRIGVMKDGNLVEVGEPIRLYNHPRTAYVADFLDVGTVIRGRNTRYGRLVEISATDLAVRAELTGPALDAPLAAVIPAGRVRLVPAASVAGDGDIRARGAISRVVFTGANMVAHVRVGIGLEVKASLTSDQVSNFGADLASGTAVTLAWNSEDIILVEDELSDRC